MYDGEYDGEVNPYSNSEEAEIEELVIENPTKDHKTVNITAIVVPTVIGGIMLFIVIIYLVKK